MIDTILTHHQWLVIIPLTPIALVALALWECRP